jgi:hypothetical protein
VSLTLGELRRKLAEFDGLPDDTLLVLSQDAAGNSYSPLCEIEEAGYLPENTWSGEHYALDDAPDGIVRALFLWSTH